MITVGGTEAKRLIVNADDLAVHSAVNRAVFRAHREGIVTSTSLLAGGTAFSEAIEELKRHPGLGIGLHLCLVDQVPVLNPEKIPTLVGSNGRLMSNYLIFVKRFLLNKIRREDIKSELVAQVEKAVDHGLTLTHLDSHQHLHILPGITRLVKEIGQRFGIMKIRIPAENMRIAGLQVLSRRRLQGRWVYSLAQSCRRMLEHSGWTTPDRFYGFMRGGRMLKGDWHFLIPRLSAGVTEIMVHPGEDDLILKSHTGWDYCWEDELRALVDPEIKALLEEHTIELINFGHL